MPEWTKAVWRFLCFYLHALRWSWEGAWGAIGIVTTIVPIFLAVVADNSALARAFPWIARLSELMVDAIGWKVPILIGAAVLASRMVYGPYKFYKEQRDRADALDDYIKPRLSVSMDSTVDGCRVGANFPPSNYAIFWRLRVCSQSMKPIRKCTGFITKITGPGGVNMEHESVQLTFADGNASDALNKSIYGKVPAFLDVLAILDDGRVLICTKGFAVPFIFGGAVFAERGDYIITVGVAGKGIQSVVADLKLVWTGDQRTAALSLVAVR